MHFCGKCDNMYYLRLSEANSNKLIHYCRNCGNEETITNNESICISNNELMHAYGFLSVLEEMDDSDPLLAELFPTLNE